ncbi:MAG: YchE family NAAT transporter [Desulfobulbaceae bacterium]|nr:YchE family NAAT transporter [Desulfobulbaceae bacterium]
MDNWTEYVKTFAGLIAIVNPVGAIPVFISLTGDRSAEEKKRTGMVAAFAVALILGAALVAGERLLLFFGISIASFRVGGGLLILLMAISMMHAKLSPVRHTEEEAAAAAEMDSVAVVPLGIPLLAGPGAISTIILYVHRSTSVMHYLILGGEIVLVALAVWLCFRSAPYVASALGRTGINVVTRIMGLIMAALGVEFITNGLKQIFPVLG